MKKTSNRLFYLPAKERTAYIFLSLLIIGWHTLSQSCDRLFGPSQDEIFKIAVSIIENEKLINTQDRRVLISSLPTVHLNDFNEEELRQYGFSKHGAINLKKYISAGGTITSFADFDKIYGVDTSVIARYKNKFKYFKPKEIITSKTKTPNKQHNSSIIKTNSSKTISGSEVQIINKKSINPNVASSEDLIDIGFSIFATQNLIKYREKGGTFQSEDDIKKIYGVDDILYNQVKDFILYEADSTSHSPTVFEEQQELRLEKDTSTHHQLDMAEPILIDINHASADQLKTIYGIGSVISSGIISYREKLGGYRSIDQLKEVYGVTDENFLTITNQLNLTGEVTKMYIPAMTFKEVLRHPYIDYETTKLLKNIPFEIYDEKIKRLIEEKAIDNRIIPYLYLDIPAEYLHSNTVNQ